MHLAYQFRGKTSPGNPGSATGEILSGLLPAALFVRLGITAADIDRARERYRAAP
jgi:hypothetical protein